MERAGKRKAYSSYSNRCGDFPEDGALFMPGKKKVYSSHSYRCGEFPEDGAIFMSSKEALHVSTSPSTILCRENGQSRILEFCKNCVKQESSGSSMYICGCPGTGKSLTMEKVQEALIAWAKEAGFQPPDVDMLYPSIVHLYQTVLKYLARYWEQIHNRRKKVAPFHL